MKFLSSVGWAADSREPGSCVLVPCRVNDGARHGLSRSSSGKLQAPYVSLRAGATWRPWRELKLSGKAGMSNHAAARKKLFHEASDKKINADIIASKSYYVVHRRRSKIRLSSENDCLERHRCCHDEKATYLVEKEVGRVFNCSQSH